MTKQIIDINIIRHSISHLMSMAIMKLYPKAGLGVGPFIENGFYQDYDLPESISEEIFPKLEKRIKEMIKQDIEFKQHNLDFAEALKLYKHDPYKTELIADLKTAGEKEVSFYKSDWFENLCKGPHVKSTKEINPEAFKLTSIAGAYWRGNEKNKMLTRIYGVAFATKKELDDYLLMKEEAEKRDHKKIGAALGLFAFSPLVGSGLPLFLPKGATLLRELAEFVRTEKINRGYAFVQIPHIAKSDLYQKSGHLGKYDAMMPLMTDSEGDQFAMKAMNCPHHFELFNATQHSYRDLPIRYAETTTVYRNEKSGELSGLLRVKALTQDDTHHFVRHDQIQDEIKMILGLMDAVYSAFGFSEFLVQISIRDTLDTTKYFGADDLWQKSEKILIDAVKNWGKPYVIEEGEAAFYGPKIDIMVKDAIGRHWQLTTVQLDFNQPENFDLHYIGEDGQKHRPAVLHVAILGSLERFLGVLIEHFSGAFPLWLAPTQIKILNVGADHEDFCKKLADEFKAQDLRVELDLANETIGNKIRKASAEKIPYTLVIGDKEMSGGPLAVRVRGQKDMINVAKDQFLKELVENVANRKLSL
ncbi:MAG: threonine--tRNA ligase [Candidatus Komeilibacteria bacterium]|nr:threonine--tRNA ligase [Candidatus Komeilibacteria bacterium]